MFNIQIIKRVVSVAVLTVMVGSLVITPILNTAQAADAECYDNIVKLNTPGIDIDGNRATAAIKNRSSVDCTVTLVSYNINKNNGGSAPHYIPGQTIFRTDTRNVGPKQTLTLSVGVPNCYSQVDLVHDNAITPPTYSSADMIGVQFGGDPNSYCDEVSPAPTADIKANGSDGPITIAYNTAATISWTSTDTSNCTVGGWTGKTGSQSSGPLTATQTFTLDCTGTNGQHIEDKVTVNVEAKKECMGASVGTAAATDITTNAATFHGFVNANNTNAVVFFEYGLSATSFPFKTASQTFTGSVSKPVSSVVGGLQPNTTYYYRLAATNICGGTDIVAATTNFTTKNVPAAPTADIKANGQDGPITIAYNTAATISWTSTNATSCTVTPTGWTGITGSQSSGNLTASKSYTLNCLGTNGAWASDNVTVNVQGQVLAPTADIKANGQDGVVTVQYNTSANITWSSTNANSCSVSPTGWTGISGSQSSGNITGGITYTLTCTGSNGQSATDNVTVQPTQVNNQLPTVTLTASPTVVNVGQSSVLSWYSANANSCYASTGPWSGNKSLSGSETVSPNLTVTYQITCSNNFGSASAVATVIVNNVTSNNTISVNKSVRNITLNQTSFSQNVEAQGLDNLEFEIRVRNTDNVGRTVTVQDILPSELFYVPGSTTVNGASSQDGIVGSGLNLGYMNPGEEKVVRFRSVVFVGTSNRTITNQANASGVSGSASANVFGNAFATVQIVNRGQVLGVSDIVTGPENTLMLSVLIGFLFALGLSLAGKRFGWFNALAPVGRSKRNIDEVLLELQRKANAS